MKGRLALVPGIVGWLLATGVACLGAFWSVAEMFHEGWWGELGPRFVYLLPGAIIVTLATVAVRWPGTGGAFLVAVGTALSLAWRFYFRNAVGVQLGLIFVLIGVLFVIEGVRLRRAGDAAPTLPTLAARLRARLPDRLGSPWLWHHWRTAVTLGLPLILVLGTVATWAVLLSLRVDDGDRGARRITADGVDLVWAPEGPGWAKGWLQGDEHAADLAAGGAGYRNPSWDRLALYGLPPVGLADKPAYRDTTSGAVVRHATRGELDEYCLCRYLSEDGLRLLESPQDVWRLPTVAEIAASLPHHGEPAGCVWGGTAGPMDCDDRPDKETPLWDPTRSPVYLLSADEADSARVWFVSYNGRVHAVPKHAGNPRHGFRCVRRP